MNTLRVAISGHPITAFLIIAYAFTYILTFATSISIAFGLLGLFGPAIAAIIVSWSDHTIPQLRARIVGWRRPAGWYVLAFGIPFGVAAVARIILVASGTPVNGMGSITAIEAVIFVLVIGEEIGWRGFLQPRLRLRMSLPVAGVATGIAWVMWHLPLYLAPDQGIEAFVRFAWWVIPLSVTMGVVAEWARFSVIVATVMHGAANIATPILLPSVDRTWWLVATGALYVVVAAVLVVVARQRGADEPAPATVSAP